jgi:flagellar basal-body rod protein FlgB
MIGKLVGNLDFQAQALVLRAERQRVLSSNIANVDTPGYIGRDIDFRKSLEAATDSNASNVAMTNADHMNGSSATNGRPSLVYTTTSQPSIDQNTVDLDRERANFTDNSIRYESTLRFITGQVRTMLTAITGQ